MEDQLARIRRSRPANLWERSTTNVRNRYVFIETAPLIRIAVDPQAGAML
ncbi:MAG: hypothetical protein IIA64_01740 [Planctomycetes bacterium]|nr:hypothetical protein [Planctomycetota bacterium]